MEFLLVLKERLEEKGIPATIQGKNTASMMIPRFAFEPTIWIYIDDQYDEARQLLDDPGYLVQNRLDVAEFYENLPTETEQRKVLNHAFLHLGWVVGLIVLALLFILKLLNSI
ncbi:MAG: DUF2007 domain-containing protein [Gammaproteobacteria bacterium]|nr:DUF2007 domain-containing protein [Gammaproteobacteria bacterium]